jgi:hypothetical protein
MTLGAIDMDLADSENTQNSLGDSMFIALIAKSIESG